jgi:solute:Na+ symporter, SSS family
VVLNIPAILIALKKYDILKLFLIADLLCTATVGPMLLAAWKRAHSVGAIAGCVAGLLTIFVHGAIVKGSFVGGFEWFVLPEGLYSYNSMVTFILALVIPTATTVGVSLALPQETSLRSKYMPAATPINYA